MVKEIINKLRKIVWQFSKSATATAWKELENEQELCDEKNMK